MANDSVDYWSKRALDFVREMEEAKLDTPSIINTVVFLTACAVHKTDSPLLSYEMILATLTGAAEDECRARPEQARLGL
jgi:hypothetical protein